MQGVYKIRNLISGKYYVGSTDDINRRWGAHRRELEKNDHCNPPLQNAWNKHDEESFVFEVAEEVVGSRVALLAREQVYLDAGFMIGVLYNISSVASGRSWVGENHHWRGGDQSGENNAFYGQHHSSATKLQMSTSRRGKNNPFYGKTHTEETKARQRKAKSGENHPGYGKPRSKETRAKISGALIGRRLSEEHCIKLAKPYPAFSNSETGQFIPAGINLRRMCRGLDLSHGIMWNLKRDKSKKNRDGWRLATISEVTDYEEGLL